MEQYAVYLVAFAIGLVYFGIVMLLVNKFRFKYSLGLVLPLAAIVFFAIMAFIGGQQDQTGWQQLGYVIMTALAVVATLGYLAGWIGVRAFSKGK